MNKQALNALGYSKDDVAGMELVKKLEKLVQTVDGLATLPAAMAPLETALAAMTHAKLKPTFEVRARWLHVISALVRKDEVALAALAKGDASLVRLALGDLAAAALDSRKKKQIVVARTLVAAAQALNVAGLDELVAQIQ